MSRWVRIQTSIFDHEVFAAEPFSEREAWMWLISKAAWKDTKHRIGHNVVEVPTGSMFLTLREMQATWRWKSDKRVRSFLSMLEREEMIETKTDAGKTQVSICNYSRYQDAERKEDATGTQDGRSADALKTPIHQYTNTSSLRSEECASAPSPIDEAISIYSEAASKAGLPVPRKVTADRRRKIEARLREHSINDWREACQRLADSDFCRGANDRGWRADLDFLLQPKSFNGLLEGKYDTRKPQHQATAPPQRPPRTVAELAIHRLETGQPRNEQPDTNGRRLGESHGPRQTQGPGVLELVAIAANGYGRNQ